MTHARFCSRSLAAAAVLWQAVALAEPPPEAPPTPPAVAQDEASPSPSSPPPPEPAPVADAAKPKVEAKPNAAQVSARMDALMDRMVQARTRLSAIGESLYQTRIRIALEHRVKGFRIERVRLFLDGAPVYAGQGEGLVRGESVSLHSGFAAPGMHDVRLEIDQVSKDDGRYGYTLEQRFRFRAVEDEHTEVRIRMDDDSDIAEDFEDDQDGEYDVRTRVRVRALPATES